MTAATAVEPQSSTEVLIHGVLYDAAGFKHPGGSIIKWYMGGPDATEAFDQFHLKSTRAEKYLKNLPKRDAPPPPPSVAADPRAAQLRKFSKEFGAMVQQLRADGWYDRDLGHVFYRVAEIVIMHAVGFYLMLNTSYWLIGLAIAAIAQGRCGWLMHEGGHISLTGNSKLDIRLQELFYGLGCGMSAAWWRNQHNKHHATPQKLKHDVDLDTLPMVAFNAAIAKVGSRNPLARFFVPLQAYLFVPVICCLVTLQWQFFLHLRHMYRTKRFAEAFWILVRFAIIYQLAQVAGTTLAQSIGLYVLYDVVGGSYIFANFALSHTHLDVTKPDDVTHWMEYASKYTINIAPHWFTNWWMGYLNFQIEHHLFPSMPQFKFPKLSATTRQLFERNGLKYDSRGYFVALRRTFANLHEVGQAI